MVIGFRAALEQESTNKCAIYILTKFFRLERFCGVRLSRAKVQFHAFLHNSRAT